MEEYYVAASEGTAEIIEKKSKFIAHVFYVDSEEKAYGYIRQTEKRYWDARHNCFAFVIGRNNETKRFSDDGEPQGTAGKPILETLESSNIHNVLVIVTRYFGGTLLGTGGLVRAYGNAAKASIENTVLKKVSRGIKISMLADYNSAGKIKHIVRQPGITVLDEQYSDKVVIVAKIKEQLYERVISEITDAPAAPSG